jgi:hypothetical protein
MGLSVSFPFEIKHADAMTISYPTLNIQTTGQTNFSDPGFYFVIGNNEAYNISVRPYGEILGMRYWENNFSFAFQFDNPTNSNYLPIGQTVKVYPKVNISVDLTFVYPVHFVFQGFIEDNETTGNILVAAVGATANFDIYSEELGHSLIIRTTDQSLKERNSEIEIKFGGHDPNIPGQGWSPFKTISESYVKLLVPTGWYWILGTEKDNGVKSDEKVFVSNKTEVNIIYALITFHYFSVLAPDNISDSIKVNFTVKNDYANLQDVKIQFTLLNSKDETKSLNFVDYTIPDFDKGTYEGTFKFKNEYEDALYLIKKEIIVGESSYVIDLYELDLSFPENDPFYIPQQTIINAITNIIIIAIIFATGIASRDVYRKIKGVKTTWAEKQPIKEIEPDVDTERPEF